MKITLQIIQYSFQQEVPSILITINDTYQYIFNVPSSFQRTHDKKMPHYGNFFFTKTCPTSMAGLNGYLLGIYQFLDYSKLRLYLEDRLYNYMEDMRYLSGHRMLAVSYATWNGKCRKGTQDHELIEQTLEKQNYIDIFQKIEEFMTQNTKPQKIINALEGLNIQKKCYQDQFLKIYPFSIDQNGILITNYIVSIRQLEGYVLKQQIKKLNIPYDLIQTIVDQGCIQLPDGRTIHKKQIISPPHPGPHIFILHISSQSTILKILKNQIFIKFVENSQLFIQAAIYIIQQSKLIENQVFKKLINCFPEKAQHIISGRGYVDKEMSIENWVRMPLVLTGDLNKNGHFGIPNLLEQHKNDVCQYYSKSPSIDDKIPNKTIQMAKNRYQFVIVPIKYQKYQPKTHNEKQFTFVVPIKIEQQPVFKRTQLPWDNKQLDPNIVFLGTGSMYPNNHRNVSCVLIQWDDNNIILLDCGQSSMYQLQSHFPMNEIHKKILNIRIIFISHMHSDHNAGILDLISKRTKLMKQYGDDRKLFLMLPCNVYPWLYSYLKYIDNFTLGCQILLIQTITKQNYEFCMATQVKHSQLPKQSFLPKKQQILVHLPINKPLLSQIESKSALQVSILQNFQKYLESQGITSFLPVHVQHCVQSYGVVIEHRSSFKLSYSGDCRPSQDFITASNLSTLLIHQSTFGDNLKSRAIDRFHTSVGEAIQVGIKSKSWKTALTHFSQRYLTCIKIANPSLYEEHQQIKRYLTDHTIIGYDHLEFKMSQIQKVPMQTQNISKSICPK